MRNPPSNKDHKIDFYLNDEKITLKIRSIDDQISTIKSRYKTNFAGKPLPIEYYDKIKTLEKWKEEGHSYVDTKHFDKIDYKNNPQPFSDENIQHIRRDLLGNKKTRNTLNLEDEKLKILEKIDQAMAKADNALPARTTPPSNTLPINTGRQHTSNSQTSSQIKTRQQNSNSNPQPPIIAPPPQSSTENSQNLMSNVVSGISSHLTSFFNLWKQETKKSSSKNTSQPQTRQEPPQPQPRQQQPYQPQQPQQPYQPQPRQPQQNSQPPLRPSNSPRDAKVQNLSQTINFDYELHKNIVLEYKAYDKELKKIDKKIEEKTDIKLSRQSAIAFRQKKWSEFLTFRDSLKNSFNDLVSRSNFDSTIQDQLTKIAEQEFEKNYDFSSNESRLIRTFKELEDRISNIKKSCSKDDCKKIDKLKEYLNASRHVIIVEKKLREYSPSSHDYVHQDRAHDNNRYLTTKERDEYQAHITYRETKNTWGLTNYQNNDIFTFFAEKHQFGSRMKNYFEEMKGKFKIKTQNAIDRSAHQVR